MKPMEIKFKDLEIEQEFSCWGDIHLNYDYPVEVVAYKDNETTAIEIEEDGSEGIRFAMNPNDVVWTTDYIEEVEPDLYETIKEKQKPSEEERLKEYKMTPIGEIEIPIEDIQYRAEQIQNYIHETIEQAYEQTEDKSKFNYQDVTNVVLMRYIAELELKIEKLTTETYKIVEE